LLNMATLLLDDLAAVLRLLRAAGAANAGDPHGVSADTTDWHHLGEALGCTAA
jgi:hypothetical protein